MPTPLASQLAPLSRAARATELRLRTAEAARAFFLGAIPTLTAASGLVLQIKLTHGYHGKLYVTLVTLVAVSAAVTLAFVTRAFVRRYPRYAGAIRLDSTFQLQDRVTSALSFAETPDDQRTPLMDAAIEDAIAHRSALVPGRAAPLLPSLLTPDVAATVVLSAMVIGLTMLQWSSRVVIPRAATIDAVSLGADDLDLFRDTLEQLAEKDPSPETKEALQQFNQLIEDLAQKRLDRAEAFRRMDALEKGLLKGREADAKALEDALKNAAEKLKDSPLSKPAAEALAKKDFAKAQEELKKLAEKLRDKQNKITEADKKRLKEALANAAKVQKETLARLEKAREEMRASLLAREQKASQSEEERRLLNRDKRELDRLDREIEQKERAQRQLDRLDRELSQAAEDLMKELGLSADDLDKGAEDINRMAKEEMTEKEKEELRQRLQELREMLRQQGQGGEELKKRMRKFAKRAHGKQGQEGQPGGGKKGQPGKEGEEGDDGEEEGEGKPGEKGKGKGPGQGEGEWVIGPGGKKTFVMKGGGNRPGDGQGQGQGQQPGQGEGNQPGGNGTEPGGKSWGTGHDGNLAGKKGTGGKFATQDVQEAATDTGQGPSVSETIQAAAEKGFVSRSYKKVYADYRTKAEEAMKNEDIPPGYRFYVQRYFQLIRPRE